VPHASTVDGEADAKRTVVDDGGKTKVKAKNAGYGWGGVPKCLPRSKVLYNDKKKAANFCGFVFFFS